VRRQRNGNSFLQAARRALACLFVILLISCGGGGGGSSSSTPASTPATITSVTVSCAAAQVQVSQTVQCSASVQGTGNFNSTVTWTVQGGGSINSSGLYTAPATVPSPPQSTIMATSVQDTTKSGTAAVTITPPPTITSVSVLPSSATLVTNQTQQFTAQVAGTGNFSTAVNWKVNDVSGGNSTVGTITSSGLYAAPVAVPNPAVVAVKAVSTQDPAKSGSANVTITAPQSPTIVISPASTTVALGGSFAFGMTIIGSPTPSVSCSVNGAGSVQVSGTTATYSVPLPQPTSFSATLNCTAKNTSGSASTAAQISLQYPVPVITGPSPAIFDCVFLLCIQGFQVTGKGFYPGGIVHDSLFGDLTLPQGVDPQLLVFVSGFDTPHDSPGWIDFSVSTPPGGPGGGTSNAVKYAYLRPYNSLVTSAGKGYQLLPPSGVYAYDLSTGALLGHGGGAADANGIAVDDKTGNILVSSFVFPNQNVNIFDPTFQFLGGAATTDKQTVSAVAAGSGYGCVSIPGDRSVAVFPFVFSFRDGIAPIQPGTQTGTNPWPVVMTTLNGLPACIAFDPTDLTISVVQESTTLGVPGTQLLRTIPVPNLLTFNQATNQSTRPGWQLVTFDSGPSQGAAALLSDADNQLVFVDLNKGQEIRRVTLSGAPFNIAVDNTHGLVILANADVSAGVTRFQSVDPASGTVNDLAITSDMLATGLAVSADGTKLFVANRDQFQTLVLPASPPIISVSVSPSSLSMNTGGMQEFTANVTGILDSNVTWSVDGVPGGNPTVGLITATGLYVAPAVPPAPPTVTVHAISVRSSSAIGGAAVTISSGAIGSPTVSVSQSQVVVELGSSISFNATASGSGISATGCKVIGHGSVELNGNQVTYTAPVQKPSSFTAFVTCSATNSAGTGSATVLVNLQYPLPSVATVTPVVVCPRECTATFTLTGSGFYPGGIVHIAPLGDVPVPGDAAPGQMSVPLDLRPFPYGSNFSPGWLDFSVSSPTDHSGGGQSNSVSAVFLSAFNTVFPTVSFPSAGFFLQLDQSSGSIGGGVPFFDATVYDVAADVETSGVLATEPGGVFIVESAQPTTIVSLLSGIHMPLALAEKGGYVCSSQDQDNQLTRIDLRQTGFPFAAIPLGGTPWDVAMFSPSSSEVDCVAFNAGDLALSVVRMADLTLVRSVTLTGLTSLSNVTTPPGGGWQLVVFDVSPFPFPVFPAAGTAAVLSQADGIVVFVNLTTGQEIRRVTLNGLPIRIAPDNYHGALIVAVADTFAHLTRFQKIDVVTGTVSTLQTTSTLLVTGLGVSSDGTQLIVGMRSERQVLPNQ